MSGVLVMAPAGILLLVIKGSFVGLVIPSVDLVLVVVVGLPLPGSCTQLIGLISIIKNPYEPTYFQDQSSWWTQSGPTPLPPAVNASVSIDCSKLTCKHEHWFS
jgi:hypothetical protein